MGNILKIRNDADDDWLQPNQWVYESFAYAYLTTAMTNLATNTTHTVQLDGTIANVGADFDTTNHQYVAPQDGYYLFIGAYLAQQVDQVTGIKLDIVTSNRTYTAYFNTAVWDSDSNYWPRQMTLLTWMDASDTAKVIFYQQGGAAQTDLYNSSQSTYMICALMTTS